MAVFTAFFAYLSRSFTGPEEPKFLVEPFMADIAKETYHPGIVPEHYYLPQKVKPAFN